MSRSFSIPGAIILFLALALNFLASISLPYLPALDITRVHAAKGFQQGSKGLSEIRLGIWGPCVYDEKGERACIKTGHGYQLQLANPTQTEQVTIAASWTRGLAIHPVATAFTAVAFGMAFSSHLTISFLAALASILAAFMTLLAFACDIALFAWTKHQVNKLNIGASTITGPGFWITFAAFILILIGGCAVLFGWRRNRMAGATTTHSYKKPFWSRFRRN